MKFAILKGRELLRYEHDGDTEVPPGARRLPVVIQAKPDHDPQTQYLDSYWQLADDGSCVGILYTIHDSPPKTPPPPFGGPPVVVERVVERIVEQTTNENVEALRRAVAEMQAVHAETQTAQRIGDLIGTVMNGKDDAAIAAANALVPLADAEGLSVDEFVRRWLNKGAVAA